MRDAGLILDWDTLIHTDKFYQAKTTRLVTLPLAPWHSSCQHLPHILCILDIICQENMTLPVIMVTASLLTGNGRSARLLYLLTFSSPRQVGGWEPGSSQEVTLPLIPDEDMEINQHEHLYPVWKDFVWSQSVSGVQSKSHKDTLWMTPSWWLRMGDPVCMCITLCQWSEHYLLVGRCFIRLNDSIFFLNFSFLWKKLIPLARSCPTKVLQEFSKLWLWQCHDW